MKRGTLGLEIHKQRLTELAEAAMLEVEKLPVFEGADIRREFIVSRLKTRISCVRRGATITYTLIVPEVNQTFVRRERTDSEFQAGR
jgi:hypothetical protein